MKLLSCCFLLTLAFIWLSGCQPAGSMPLSEPTQETASTSTVLIHPSPTTDTTNPATQGQEDDMPKDPPLPFPRNPGLQALIERAKADLAQRLSISTSQIKALETKEAAWPDASLGCPQPGTVYAQIPTPGYLIMLEYAGDEFEYHASIRGDAFYCENPTPPISETPADIYSFYTPAP